MNDENDNAMQQSRKIESLERELRALLANAAIDATGFGRRKGFPAAAIGVGKDAADILKINEEIKEKISAMSYVIQYQKEAENFERVIERLQNQIDRMGCR